MVGLRSNDVTRVVKSLTFLHGKLKDASPAHQSIRRLRIQSATLVVGLEFALEATEIDSTAAIKAGFAFFGEVALPLSLLTPVQVCQLAPLVLQSGLQSIGADANKELEAAIRASLQGIVATGGEGLWAKRGTLEALTAALRGSARQKGAVRFILQQCMRPLGPAYQPAAAYATLSRHMVTWLQDNYNQLKSAPSDSQDPDDSQDHERFFRSLVPGAAAEDVEHFSACFTRYQEVMGSMVGKGETVARLQRYFGGGEREEPVIAEDAVGAKEGGQRLVDRRKEINARGTEARLASFKAEAKQALTEMNAVGNEVRALTGKIKQISPDAAVRNLMSYQAAVTFVQAVGNRQAAPVAEGMVVMYDGLKSKMCRVLVQDMRAQADALSGLLDLGGASAGVLVAKASRLLFTTLDAVDVMGTHLPALANGMSVAALGADAKLDVVARCIYKHERLFSRLFRAVEIAELLLPVLAGDAAAVATRDTNVVAYGPGLLEAVGRLRKERRPEHAEALRSVDAMLAAAPHSANQAQALLDGLKTASLEVRVPVVRALLPRRFGRSMKKLKKYGVAVVPAAILEEWVRVVLQTHGDEQLDGLRHFLESVAMAMRRVRAESPLAHEVTKVLLELRAGAGQGAQAGRAIVDPLHRCFDVITQWARDETTAANHAQQQANQAQLLAAVAAAKAGSMAEQAPVEAVTAQLDGMSLSERLARVQAKFEEAATFMDDEELGAAAEADADAAAVQPLDLAALAAAGSTTAGAKKVGIMCQAAMAGEGKEAEQAQVQLAATAASLLSPEASVFHPPTHPNPTPNWPN
ncbi:hypothetical protein C2E20_3627 [Micractinium conductrix]|uniref:Uncharacterized protein n=1 Tax=Micractinium conductrix TaxID=554055 RepID=A0A2P6VFX3_9CHLO|nr:hypothetical protein C2E20_3627 [Micractinium conductrix]|eukprot:PSC72996.1 hypothetical protein C2E20_3627 [Micractinium conductrix]